jgi:hypothetical protein
MYVLHEQTHWRQQLEAYEYLHSAVSKTVRKFTQLCLLSRLYTTWQTTDSLQNKSRNIKVSWNAKCNQNFSLLRIRLFVPAPFILVSVVASLDNKAADFSCLGYSASLLKPKRQHQSSARLSLYCLLKKGQGWNTHRARTHARTHRYCRTVRPVYYVNSVLVFLLPMLRINSIFFWHENHHSALQSL